ncbi:MAG TPA: ABC transporter ATP-binding protein [Dermatophilaceae bacterium]|nr:ABC transporter ATP-binding protein [Dermatophilaceae bacterium]
MFYWAMAVDTSPEPPAAHATGRGEEEPPGSPTADPNADRTEDRTADPTEDPTAERTRWENLRLLADLVRPHRRTLAVGVVLGLGSTAVGLATPLAVKWVLDTLGGRGSLSGPVGLLLGLLAVGSVAGFAQWLLLGRLAERVVLDVRLLLLGRFVRGVLGDVQRHAPGELVSRVTSDTVLLRQAASFSAVQIVNGVVAFVGTVVLMAVLDVQLLLTTLVCVGGIVAMMALLMPRIARAERSAQDSLGRLGGGLEGSMRALRTVKAAGAEDRQVADLARSAEDARRHSLDAVQTTAVVWTVAGVGIQLAVIAILAIGAWRVGQGDLAVSTLVAFLLYVFALMDPISTLTSSVRQLQSGLAAAARIRDTEAVRVEDPGPPAERAGPPPGPVATPVAAIDRAASEPGRADAGPGDGGALLVVDDVSFTYAGAPAPTLRNLSFVVPRHGHVALVGPSGAGKTTTMSLLLRFMEPDSGAILLDGVPYDRLGLRATRSRMAYVEQESPLVGGTLRENLVLRHPDASEQEIWAALRAVRLADVVAGLADGLDTPLLATDLSGGERQRVALARAVVRLPELLLLDEATAQLDGLTEAAVHDVIARVAAQGAVLTIAHRLSTVVDADEILLLDGGGLRARGTHGELLAVDEMYRELVRALRIHTPEGGATPVPEPAGETGATT